MKQPFPQKNADENAQVLNEIFRIANQALPLIDILEKSLDVLLSLSWLSLLPKAGIFLTEKSTNGDDRLRLVVNRNLGHEISQRCAIVNFGHCLCGQTAQTKLPVYASCIDSRHEIRFDGMPPHGHYNIPIISSNGVLGILAFYLPDGAPYNKDQQDFLVRCVAILSLVIELRRKEQALEQKVIELDLQKRTLDEHAIVSIANREGAIIYVNDKFCQISGYTRDELIGNNHRILKSGDHSTEFYENLWRTISSGNTWHGEIKNRRKAGGYYWVSATIVPFPDSKGQPYQYVAIRTDITERKEMEYSLKLAQGVAKMGSWSLDSFVNHLFWSDEIYNIFGIKREEFGASLEAFLNAVHPEDRDYVMDQFQASIEGKRSYDIEHRIVRKDTGEIRWVHEKCIHQRNDFGEVIRSDGTVQDITERKLAQDKIAYMAHHDGLTGLPNRALFSDRLQQALSLAHRKKSRLALMFIDLDKFKPVNDTLGHEIGDLLLKEVAKRMQDCVRESDTIGRIGGDEFVVLLQEINDENGAFLVAESIRQALTRPFSLGEHMLSISSSIGLAYYPEHGENELQLTKSADIAMYLAKQSGRDRAMVYRPGMTV